MTEHYPHLDNKALEDIRATHRRSLALLAGQAAGFGELYVPPPLHHQIEQARAAIDAIDQELARRGIQSADSSHATPIPAVSTRYDIHGDFIASNSTTNGSVTITGGSVNGHVAGVNHGTVQYGEDGRTHSRSTITERGT